MFGRARKQRKLSAGIIEYRDKTLVQIEREAADSPWFERGQNAAGRDALTRFVARTAATESAAHVALTGLSPELRAQLEEASHDLNDQIRYLRAMADSGGLIMFQGKPPSASIGYRGMNCATRLASRLGIDTDGDGPARAADAVILAAVCDIAVLSYEDGPSSSDKCLQSLGIALVTGLTLLGSWLESPERASLDDG